MSPARVSLRSVACLLVLAGCGSTTTTPSSDEPGDCTAKLRIGDTTYAFHEDAVTSHPAPVKPLAAGEILDCDGKVVDTATPVQMRGVPVSVAVAVVEGWPGIYVAEGVAPSTWPDRLRR
ncbi:MULTISPECIES: hypothetical protein [Nocardioides]|uniref:Lipoprotein n=1 Tax=Nocardioides vastitatis TaxID=2568655 RepID=A0ABW0ZGE3_9ACTN|nr:hypothetical protein [Nocardioides sp.]THI97827.1 hypothetical protein E7Z54_14445 [Nocardioides sp.]